MRVIKKRTLVEYYTKNPQAKDALEDWYVKTEDAEWHNFADIRTTFNSVDYVGILREMILDLWLLCKSLRNRCLYVLWALMPNMIK